MGDENEILVWIRARDVSDSHLGGRLLGFKCEWLSLTSIRSWGNDGHIRENTHTPIALRLYVNMWCQNLKSWTFSPLTLWRSPDSPTSGIKAMVSFSGERKWDLSMDQGLWCGWPTLVEKIIGIQVWVVNFHID